MLVKKMSISCFIFKFLDTPFYLLLDDIEPWFIFSYNFAVGAALIITQHFMLLGKVKLKFSNQSI